MIKLAEAGWMCPKCGTFNVGTNKCKSCGHEVLPVTPKPVMRGKRKEK